MLDFVLKHFIVKQQRLPEVRVICPWCIDIVGKQDERGHLYINIDKEAGYCQRCNKRIGSKQHLYTLFNLTEPIPTIDAYETMVKDLDKKFNPPVREDPAIEVIDFPEEVISLTPPYKSYIAKHFVKAAKEYLYKRGLSDYDIDKYQLHVGIGGPLKSRIIIPFYHQGKLVGYTGRLMVNSKFAERYKDSPGPQLSRCLPFLDWFTGLSKYIVLVEGFFKMVRLHKLDIPAVPLNGSSIHMPQLNLLKGFEKIILLLDTDKISEAKRIQKHLNNDALFVAINNTGKDLDDLDDGVIYNILDTCCNYNSLEGLLVICGTQI